MKTTSRITSKGQVTIPQHIREALGLLPNTEATFILENDGVRLVKSRQANARGTALVGALKGTATVKMSTDEIMKHTRRIK